MQVHWKGIRKEEDGLGWHKLAFPCGRFINAVPGCKRSITQSGYRKNKRSPRMIPVFCAFDSLLKSTNIYVFPR